MQLILKFVYVCCTLFFCLSGDYSFQLTTMHSHLDEMDRKLENLEDQVHESMIASQADSMFSEDDSVYSGDSLRSNILRDHRDVVLNFVLLTWGLGAKGAFAW